MKFLFNLILALLLLTTNIKAKNYFGIGTGILYTNVKEKFSNEYEEITSPKPILNLSYVKTFENNFVINSTTNRVGNNARIRTVRTSRGELQVKTTTNIDTISIGYRLGNFTPYFLTGNVNLRQKIRYNNKTLKTDYESALIYGTALSYRFSNQTISINLIAPSKPLNLRYAVGLGYNFYF